MKEIRTIFLIIVVAIISGCSSLNNITTLTAKEIKIVVQRARNTIVEKIKLTPKESAFINSQTPTIGYYVISGKSYTQYFVTWKFKNKLEVTYEGLGDIKSDDSFRRIHYGTWSPKLKY